METNVQQLKREAAQKVLDEAQRNPQAYVGKFVGIANGQIVVVTDDLKEAWTPTTTRRARREKNMRG